MRDVPSLFRLITVGAATRPFSAGITRLELTRCQRMWESIPISRQANEVLELPVTDAGILANLDTPEDYARLMERL